MSQESSKWILDKLIADAAIAAIVASEQTHVQTAQVDRMITTNDASSTNVVMRINGVEVINTYLSEGDTETVNVLPWLFMVACNAGLANFPESGYWDEFRAFTVDMGDGTIRLQLPTHYAYITKHSFPISAVMDPADGMTNHVNPTYPQYPEIVVTSTAPGTPFTIELDGWYSENVTVEQENEDYWLPVVTDEIIMAEPEDRPSLLKERTALIVLRSESETPNTANSQGGDRQETVYIEIRSWTKQTVHDLKRLVQAALEDVGGALPSGGMIYRVRHDWNRDPFLQPDGVTWESQIRYLVWYR